MKSFKYMAFSSESEIIELLNSKYPSGQEGRWILPCGACFAVPGFVVQDDAPRGHWIFRHAKRGDKVVDLPMEFDSKCAWIDRFDLACLIGDLEKKEKKKPGFDLYKKSLCVSQIERLTGCVAFIPEMACLQWRCQIDDTLYCMNNPYGLPSLESATENSFDVTITEGSETTTRICHMGVLVGLLKDRKLVKPSLVCGHCKEIRFEPPLSYCARCKTVYYCNKECQKNDWNLGHRTQCIAK